MNLNSIYDRLHIWQYILENITWFGHGLSSFAKDGYYNLASRPIYSHNDALQILHELGIFGFILIILFFFCILKSKRKEKFVIIAFITISMFDFVLFLPTTAFVCFLTCGYIVRKENDYYKSNILGSGIN